MSAKPQRKKATRPTRAQLDRIDLTGARFCYVPEYGTLYVHVSQQVSEHERLLVETQFNRSEMVRLRNFLNEHVGDGTVDAKVAPGAVTADEYLTLEELEQNYFARVEEAATAPPPLSRDEQHKLLAIATMRADRSVRTLVSETDLMEADLMQRGYLTTKHGRHGTVWTLTDAGRAALGRPSVSR